MVTRRQGLIGAFAALGAGVIAGGTAWWLTRPPALIPPIPMPADARPTLGVQYAVINAANGELVLESYADVKRQPASLTKMMAMAVVFRAMNSRDTRFNLQSDVTIPDYIGRVGGGIAVFDALKPGQTYHARDLLVGAGSRSDAYSTLALALHLGSPDVYNWVALAADGDNPEEIVAQQFLKAMNDLAAEIGMTNSHFSVMTGLPHKDNISTPRDIARLIGFLQQNYPSLAEITFGQPTFDIAGLSDATIHSSRLLRSRPGEIAFAKTGWTNAAGYCLGVYAQKGGHDLIGVVFGARDDAQRNDVMRDILARAATRLDETPVIARASDPIPAPT